jgi:hypothetical protein
MREEYGAPLTDRVRTPVAIYRTLYYNTDILTLFIWANHLLISFLVRRLKDLNTSASSASFKATFVTN